MLEDELTSSSSSTKPKQMYQNEIEAVLSELEAKYRGNNVSFDQSELQILARDIVLEAQKQYELIEKPLISTKEVYISHWLRETLHEEYRKKDLMHLTVSDQYTRAITQFFTLLPLGHLVEINEKLLQVRNSNKDKLFKSLNLPMADLQNAFISLAKARNELAKSQLFESMVDMHISISNIPTNTYQSFVNQIDEMLLFINKNELLSDTRAKQSGTIFEIPCDICALPSFPFETFGQVYTFVENAYPLIVPFRSKISINEGELSYTIYKKEEDKFLVSINKNLNFRHKSIDLLHELGHVVSFLEKFTNGVDPLSKGKYQAEYDAAKIQHALVRRISRKLYSAYLIEVLVLFWKVIFEIELYSQPDQDISSLYAETYNRCFNSSDYEQNELYLISENLITKPLHSLPHAVAHFQVLREYFI